MSAYYWNDTEFLTLSFFLDRKRRAREYCVQYRETDLEFISRLAAEEGMTFWQVWAENQHWLVFADFPQGMQDVPPLFYNPADQGMTEGAYIRSLRYREAVRTSDVELYDHTYLNPAHDLKTTHQPRRSLQHQFNDYHYFDSPGRYKHFNTGENFARFRLDALGADAVIACGEGIILNKFLLRKIIITT